MAKIKMSAVANPAFTSTMQALLTHKMPIKTAWKVKGLVNRFNDELKKFSDLRKEIVERHCKRGEDGNPLFDKDQNYSFEDSALESVSKEMNDLYAIEVEFDAIKVDDLGNIDLTAQQLFDLGEVVEA